MASTTTDSRSISPTHNESSLPKNTVYPPADRARLRETLIRQRASLLSEWNLSPGLPLDVEPCADSADQASNDLAQDLAIRVKMRVLAKLKRIERALLLLRTKYYGYCRRCHGVIPYERLVVQPDTRFCVRCLAVVESRLSRN